MNKFEAAKVLNISGNITQEEVKTAYRKACMRIFVILLTVLSVSAHAGYKGVLITSLDQIDEVHHFSDSYAYAPISIDDLRDVLNRNNRRMTSIIEIGRFFFNGAKGVFEYRDTSELKDLLRSSHSIAMLDEPFWWIRSACQSGKSAACYEIKSGYINTINLVKRIKFELGVQLYHVESYFELVIQKSENPDKPVIMIDSADHIGFDCYGRFDDCGGYHQMVYASWIYEAMRSHQKIFLVPGAFNFADESIVLDQLYAYESLHNQYPDLISGFGAFMWGDGYGLIGAKNMPFVKQAVENILKGLK